jgi:phage terminase large subunit-like protein
VAVLEQAMRELGVRVPYKEVTAAQGKRTRAEPVAALYEQGRVHHVGRFSELEEQLATWTGTKTIRMKSIAPAERPVLAAVRVASARLSTGRV